MNEIHQELIRIQAATQSAKVHAKSAKASVESLKPMDVAKQAEQARVKSLRLAVAAEDSDEFTPPDVEVCPACGGDAFAGGFLGKFAHYNCRQCGWWFYKEGV